MLTLKKLVWEFDALSGGACHEAIEQELRNSPDITPTVRGIMDKLLSEETNVQDLWDTGVNPGLSHAKARELETGNQGDVTAWEAVEAVLTEHNDGSVYSAVPCNCLAERTREASLSLGEWLDTVRPAGGTTWYLLGNEDAQYGEVNLGPTFSIKELWDSVEHVHQFPSVLSLRMEYQPEARLLTGYWDHDDTPTGHILIYCPTEQEEEAVRNLPFPADDREGAYTFLHYGGDLRWLHLISELGSEFFDMDDAPGREDLEAWLETYEPSFAKSQEALTDYMGRIPVEAQEVLFSKANSWAGSAEELRIYTTSLLLPDEVTQKVFRTLAEQENYPADLTPLLAAAQAALQEERT